MLYSEWDPVTVTLPGLISQTVPTKGVKLRGLSGSPAFEEGDSPELQTGLTGTEGVATGSSLRSPPPSQDFRKKQGS